MALMPCRECGKTVSTEALACPQCGAVNPTEVVFQQHTNAPVAKKKSTSFLKSTIGVFMIVALASVYANMDTKSPPNVIKDAKDGANYVYTDNNVPASNNPLGNSATPSVQPKPTCKVDWHSCLDNADMVNNYHDWPTVQTRCKSSAKDSAKYGTPEFPWFSFGSFLRGSDYPKTGIVTTIEPDAQFSNGFGAMVHTRVVCKYDLKSNAVLDVSLEANR